MATMAEIWLRRCQRWIKDPCTNLTRDRMYHAVLIAPIQIHQLNSLLICPASELNAHDDQPECGILAGLLSTRILLRARFETLVYGEVVGADEPQQAHGSELHTNRACRHRTHWLCGRRVCGWFCARVQLYRGARSAGQRRVAHGRAMLPVSASHAAVQPVLRGTVHWWVRNACASALR